MAKAAITWQRLPFCNNPSVRSFVYLFKVRGPPEVTGRPSYHPSALLKLYIYGYLNRVQSSRRLEREALRNVEMMWLLGRLAPDHKTIADFRKDNPATGPLIDLALKVD